MRAGSGVALVVWCVLLIAVFAWPALRATTDAGGTCGLPLLLNAQVGLTQAETDELNAVYGLRQAEQAYLFALGENQLAATSTVP